MNNEKIIKVLNLFTYKDAEDYGYLTKLRNIIETNKYLVGSDGYMIAFVNKSKTLVTDGKIKPIPGDTADLPNQAEKIIEQYEYAPELLTDNLYEYDFDDMREITEQKFYMIDERGYIPDAVKRPYGSRKSDYLKGVVMINNHVFPAWCLRKLAEAGKILGENTCKIIAEPIRHDKPIIFQIGELKVLVMGIRYLNLEVDFPMQFLGFIKTSQKEIEEFQAYIDRNKLSQNYIYNLWQNPYHITNELELQRKLTEIYNEFMSLTENQRRDICKRVEEMGVLKYSTLFEIYLTDLMNLIEDSQ